MGVFAAESSFTRLDDARPLRLPTAPPEAMADAEDELLEDVDSFVDWLYDECNGKPPVRIDYLPTNNAARLDLLCERSTVPELVAMQRTPFRNVIAAAGLELTKRYVAAKASRVERIAARIAGEREALHGDEA